MKSDTLQAYLTARKAKEQADRSLARAEGALTQALIRLQEQTGLQSVAEVEDMLVQEKQKLVKLEKNFQQELRRFQEQEGQRLEDIG